MQQFKHFRKSGTFQVSGMQLPGELSLDGGASRLRLSSQTDFFTRDTREIFGSLHDRLKVSLLGCVTMSGTGSGWRGEDHYHYASVFPHFAIFGDQHLSADDRKIKQVVFSVDDAPVIFYDFYAFGLAFDAKHHMERIAAAKSPGRSIEVGEYPQIFYFTGKSEILAVDTLIGRISVSHGISYQMPGPRGIHVNNTIRISIEFPEERVLSEARGAVADVLRFLQYVAGRPQKLTELSFLLSSPPVEPSQVLQVYWSLAPDRRDDNESENPEPGDLPLQGGMFPGEFADVLSNWMTRNEEWRSARMRYCKAAAFLNTYDVDRLVGAANMFDILPASVCPPDVPLTPELEDAKQAARRLFRALPTSPERASVLSALGRLGKASLKHKVRSRAQLIAQAAPDRFPEVEWVVEQAVDCRNYYVHGTSLIDYGQHTNHLSFFTDTLEFVFAASDLIDAGWNLRKFIDAGTTMSHPFGRYRVGYIGELEELKAFVAGCAALLDDKGAAV